MHLKQAGIDPTGWAFFNFGDTASSTIKVPGTASCYSCHVQEAAHDNVFTQFYPAMRRRLAEGAASGAN